MITEALALMSTSIPSSAFAGMDSLELHVLKVTKIVYLILFANSTCNLCNNLSSCNVPKIQSLWKEPVPVILH